MKSPRLKYALYWAVLTALGQMLGPLLIGVKDQYVLHRSIHPHPTLGGLWPYGLLIVSAVVSALAYAFYPVHVFLRDYRAAPRASEIGAERNSPDAQERTPPAG